MELYLFFQLPKKTFILLMFIFVYDVSHIHNVGASKCEWVYFYLIIL